MNHFTKIATSRLAPHLVFWLISYWVLLKYLAYEDTLLATDYIYTALFHFSLVIVFYGNSYFLAPRYLPRQKYAAFILGLLIIMVIGAWLNDMTFRYLSDWLLPHYYFIPYYTYFELFFFMGTYGLFSTGYVLLDSWKKLKTTEQQLVKVQRDQIRTELDLLKAQINPHFLFNSLHNIYALTLDQDKRSSEMVVLLSNVLRYALYDAQSDWISLDKDVANLEQFLQIQRIRMPEIQLSFQSKGIDQQQMIAPLLLLTLVENAFKHGNAFQDQFTINIDLEVIDRQLCFQVSNTIGKSATKLSAASGGIGLSNLQKRLDLLYPQKSQLTYRQDHSHYSAKLLLTLKTADED